MANVFDTIGTEAVAPVTTEATAAKKEKFEQMKAALKRTVQEDPSFVDRLRSLSKSLEVVNSLGFGDSGSIIVDKARSTANERALTNTSAIVGYRVRNTGAEPIKYPTEVWAKGEDGKFVPQKVEKVLAPGAYADLSRQYMTMFCAQPEISFQLANGKVIRGSGNKGTHNDIKGELEAYYFSFDREDGRQINSDEVKLNVGEKVDGKWHVKPEFCETFGFLENEKEKAGRTRKAAGEKFSTSDLAANYVMQLIKGEM